MYKVINPDGTSMKFKSLGDAFVYDVKNGCKCEIVKADYQRAYDESIERVMSRPLANLPYQYELCVILMGISRGNVDDIGWAEAANAAHVILTGKPIDVEDLEEASCSAGSAAGLTYRTSDDEAAILVNHLNSLLSIAKRDELDYKKSLKYREKIKKIIGTY